MKELGKSEVKILHAVFGFGKATRRAIVRSTRLSMAKVSSILSELEQQGYILKTRKTGTRSGRPSHLFQVRPDLGYSLGVTVGLHTFHIVAMNSIKEVIFQREISLTLSEDMATHARSIIDQLSGELSRVMAKDLIGSRPVITLGLALPGLVDPRTGTWLQGLWMPGITHVPIAGMLEEQLGVPVFVEDIARSMVFFEMHRGNGRRIRSFVLLYLGSGVGSGIVINRRIYRGFHGLAGEIGHLEHADNTYRCSCNNVGCLETVISAEGIQRVFRDRLAEGVTSSLQGDAGFPGLDRILRAAREGDRFTRSTLREIGDFLGDSCAILIKMFNPERVIISGQGSIFREFFAEAVDAVIHRSVLPEMLQNFRTIFAEYDPYQEAHGAALVAANHYFNRRLHALAGESRAKF